MNNSTRPRVFVFGTRGFPNVQGGVEKHCEYLYPLMSGYDITVSRRAPYVKNTALPSYKSIKFVDLPSTKLRGVETLLHSLLSAIYCIVKAPAIVHIHNIGPAGFAPLLKLFGFKVVLTYHSPNYEHAKWSKVEKWYLRKSESVSLKYCDHIIFVSSLQYKKFTDKIAHKSSHIPNGVNTAQFIQTKRFLKSLGADQCEYILAVGRITQEKGLDILIDAFERLQIPHLKLIIAGGVDHKSRYYEQIKSRSELNPNIILSGYTDGDDLAELYTHASVLVLPSRNEGLPIALLEAMSYSLPVIVSDIPANKAVGLDESCYFPTGDVAQLAQLISEFFSNPARPRRVSYDLGAYNWDHIATQVEQVYAKVIR